MGPTGGYIVGFILASLFLGYVVDRSVKTRGFFLIFVLMLFSSFFLIYLPGVIQLSIFTGIRDVYKLLSMGIFPFLAGDLTKIVAAALLAKAVVPEEIYTDFN